MDIEDRQEERNGPVKQFQTTNRFQEKLVEARQANDHTKIDKDFNGVCYGCFKNRYVRASIFDICQHCMSKRGHETILKVAGKKWSMYCFFCGLIQDNIFILNARLCDSCNGVVARNHKHIRKRGLKSIHPFYKKLKHDFGKDYEILMQNGANVNR